VDVLHRDVKPPNIFVMPDGGAKLGDFGVAGELSGSTHASTVVGTFAYMAPETDEGQTTPKSDVYSLGAVLFEMWTGTRPPGLARRPPTWPPGLDDALLRPLIGRMLDTDPSVRPTASEVAETLSAGSEQEATAVLGARQSVGAPAGRSIGIPAALSGTWARGVSLRMAAVAAVVVVVVAGGATLLFAGGGGSNAGDDASGPPAARGESPGDGSPTPEGTGAPAVGTPVAIGTETPTPTVTATPTATASASPTATATANPSPTVTSTPIIIATIAPLPTVTATPLPTVIIQPLPTIIAVPVDEVRILGITVDGSRYAVEFATGFDAVLPGQHVHFFYDTVPQTEAGLPGSGPWILYAGDSPFTGYTVASKPGSATQMCALVANANHSVNLGTGNCVKLP
jgi:serine/threonine-protein kinase